MDASQDTVGVRHACDVAQDRQYLAGDGQRPADGQQKGSGAAHQQELRPAEDLEQDKEWELVLCKRFSTRQTLGPELKRL